MSDNASLILSKEQTSFKEIGLFSELVETITKTLVEKADLKDKDVKHYFSIFFQKSREYISKLVEYDERLNVFESLFELNSSTVFDELSQFNSEDNTSEIINNYLPQIAIVHKLIRIFVEINKFHQGHETKKMFEAQIKDIRNIMEECLLGDDINSLFSDDIPDFLTIHSDDFTPLALQHKNKLIKMVTLFARLKSTDSTLAKMILKEMQPNSDFLDMKIGLKKIQI